MSLKREKAMPCNYSKINLISKFATKINLWWQISGNYLFKSLKIFMLEFKNIDITILLIFFYLIIFYPHDKKLFCCYLKAQVMDPLSYPIT